MPNFGETKVVDGKTYIYKKNSRGGRYGSWFLEQDNIQDSGTNPTRAVDDFQSGEGIGSFDAVELLQSGRAIGLLSEEEATELNDLLQDFSDEIDDKVQSLMKWAEKEGLSSDFKIYRTPFKGYNKDSIRSILSNKTSIFGDGVDIKSLFRKVHPLGVADKSGHFYLGVDPVKFVTDDDMSEMKDAIRKMSGKKGVDIEDFLLDGRENKARNFVGGLAAEQYFNGNKKNVYAIDSMESTYLRSVVYGSLQETIEELNILSFDMDYFRDGLRDRFLQISEHFRSEGYKPPVDYKYEPERNPEDYEMVFKKLTSKNFARSTLDSLVGRFDDMERKFRETPVSGGYTAKILEKRSPEEMTEAEKAVFVIAAYEDEVEVKRKLRDYDLVVPFSKEPDEIREFYHAYRYRYRERVRDLGNGHNVFKKNPHTPQDVLDDIEERYSMVVRSPFPEATKWLSRKR